MSTSDAEHAVSLTESEFVWNPAVRSGHDILRQRSHLESDHGIEISFSERISILLKIHFITPVHMFFFLFQKRKNKIFNISNSPHKRIVAQSTGVGATPQVTSRSIFCSPVTEIFNGNLTLFYRSERTSAQGRICSRCVQLKRQLHQWTISTQTVIKRAM